MTAHNRSEKMVVGAQRTTFRLWILGAGLVLGLAAILSLPLIFGDLGGDRGVLNWFTVFVGTFLSGSLFWWLLITRQPDQRIDLVYPILIDLITAQ